MSKWGAQEVKDEFKLLIPPSVELQEHQTDRAFFASTLTMLGQCCLFQNSHQSIRYVRSPNLSHSRGLGRHCQSKSSYSTSSSYNCRTFALSICRFVLPPHGDTLDRRTQHVTLDLQVNITTHSTRVTPTMSPHRREYSPTRVLTDSPPEPGSRHLTQRQSCRASRRHNGVIVSGSISIPLNQGAGCYLS
jgi:hypothetical protein